MCHVNAASGRSVRWRISSQFNPSFRSEAIFDSMSTSALVAKSAATIASPVLFSSLSLAETSNRIPPVLPVRIFSCSPKRALSPVNLGWYGICSEEMLMLCSSQRSRTFLPTDPMSGSSLSMWPALSPTNTIFLYAERCSGKASRSVETNNASKTLSDQSPPPTGFTRFVHVSSFSRSAVNVLAL